MAGQDPFYDYVSLLVPMSGANGSTAFADFSPTPVAVSRVGSPIIYTAASLRGDGAGWFDGSGSTLIVPASVFNFGTQPFSIEFRVNISSPASVSYPYMMAASPWNSGSGFYCVVYGAGTGWGGAGTMEFSGATTLANRMVLTSTNAIRGTGWHDIEMARDGAISRLFVDGVMEAEHIAAGVANMAADFAVIMRATPTTTDSEKGYMQDLRVTIGAVRHWADFTPDQQPLVTHQYPDRRLATAPLSGNVVMQDGSIPDLTVVRHADTRTLAAKIAPDVSGNWSVDVPPGTYDVTSFKAGCAPYCQGYYTVT